MSSEDNNIQVSKTPGQPTAQESEYRRGRPVEDGPRYGLTVVLAVALVFAYWWADSPIGEVAMRDAAALSPCMENQMDRYMDVRGSTVNYSYINLSLDRIECSRMMMRAR